MRIDPGEFRARPLRVHALLDDVPLEDVWAIRLVGGGAGRTIQDVRTVFIAAVEAAPPVVKGLFRLRGRIGALLGWDQQRLAWTAESYVHRLSPADRARSMVAPGTPDGRLSLLYRFEDEQLSELRNATVHAFSSLSIRQTSEGYLAYLAIYAQPVHRVHEGHRALPPSCRLSSHHPEGAECVGRTIWRRERVESRLTRVQPRPLQ